MPKRTQQLGNFERGVIGNASPRDIPLDALAYSENVDGSVQGIIRGVKDNTDVEYNYNPRAMVALTGEGDDLVGQDSARQFKKYSITNTSITNLGSPTADYAYSLVPYNKQVYAGMSTSFRAGDPSTPKWVGQIKHVQFYNWYALPDLTANINSTQTTITVDQIGDITAGDYVITQDYPYEEIMQVTVVNGLNLTVSRGQSYTTAQSHVSGVSLSVCVPPSSTYVVADAEARNIAFDDMLVVDSVTFTNTGPNNLLTANYYFYAFSFVYDGYQESPLYEAGDWSPTADASYATIEFTIRYNSPGDINPRITAVNLYRSESASGAAAFDSYRLVDSISLTQFGDQLPVGWSKTTSGGYSYAFTTTAFDDGEVGATYSNNAGIPETLEDAHVDYKLAEVYLSYLFVADCAHPDIPDAERYVFRSIPGAPSVIDWTSNFAVLPEKPTALVGFAGRLFVFSEKNMYRINPASMAIEDTFSGVGAISDKTVLVTNYGMFHADNDNIYLNDGRTSTPIGTPIKTLEFGNNDYGWQDIAYDDIANKNFASLAFDYENNNLLAFGRLSGVISLCWSYNLQYKRWHLLTDVDLPLATANSLDGTLYATTSDGVGGYKLISMFTAGFRKLWTIVTKDFDLDSDSGYFWIYKIVSKRIGSSSYQIKYYKDGDETTLIAPTMSGFDDLRVATIDPSDKVRSVMIRVEAGLSADQMDNITLQYRPSIRQE